MRPFIRNFIISTSALCLLPAVSFAQNFTFIYNGEQGNTKQSVYVQTRCVSSTATNNHTTNIGPLVTGTVYQVDGATLGCQSGDSVSVGVSSTNSNYNYSYCSNVTMLYSTDSSSPNANYTIDYTGDASAPYQCF